ncbi:MAG: DUF934 domain-containing protein [Kordiimonadaceae bacterium]|nr:DUF934 domain-containing protein [Kordiimonadaceae bacterium]
MTLLSLNGTVAGEWTALAADETTTAGASVAVPLARFTEESEAFFADAGSVGVILGTDTDYNDLAPLVNKLAFVVIDFPAFTDGRGFSIAVRLRKDLGFNGEIRATGHVIPDQATFLMRAGFDTADVAEERVAAFETALERFQLFYQTDYRGTKSVAHTRHTARASEGTIQGARKAS